MSSSPIRPIETVRPLTPTEDGLWAVPPLPVAQRLRPYIPRESWPDLVREKELRLTGRGIDHTTLCLICCQDIGTGSAWLRQARSHFLPSRLTAAAVDGSLSKRGVVSLPGTWSGRDDN